MTAVVVDASVLIRALAESPDDELLRRRLISSRRLLAPAHSGVEFLNGVRGLAMGRRLTESRATQAVEDYLDLPIVRFPIESLAVRIWQLRHDFNAYDAAYVALAQEYEAPLLTRDRKIEAAAPPGVEVHVYPAGK